jgi:hypothetical protein
MYIIIPVAEGGAPGTEGENGVEKVEYAGKHTPEVSCGCLEEEK